MKKTIFLILTLIVFGFFSCEENTDRFKFNGSNYVSFIESESEFTAIGGKTNEFFIEIGVTTSSTTSRSYSIELVADESTGFEGVNFNIDSKTITIAAGEFTGGAKVTPVFDEVPLEGINIMFRLIAADTAIYSIMKHNMVIGKYCNLDLASFTGDFVCDEEGYGEYLVSIAADPADENAIIISNFWDYGGELKVIFSNDESQTIDVPAQTLNMGGDEYLTSGNGSYRGCTGEFFLTTDVGGNPANQAYYPFITKSALSNHPLLKKRKQ